MRKIFAMSLGITLIFTFIFTSIIYAANPGIQLGSQHTIRYRNVFREKATLERTAKGGVFIFQMTAKSNITSVTGDFYLKNHKRRKMSHNHKKFSGKTPTYSYRNIFSMREKGRYYVYYKIKIYKKGKYQETIKGRSNMIRY